MTDPAHQRALDRLRRRRYGDERGDDERGVEVELRDLAGYDQLIPA